MDAIAARLRLNPALEVRVLAQGFRNACLIHIREFALTNDNEFVPTARGIAVPVARLGELLESVRALRAAGNKEGIVTRLQLSAGREILFTVATWQGHTKADLRTYFSKPGSTDLLPTKKGVRLNLGLLPELERGLEALDREMDK